MSDFHHLDDARDIWLAVKARFGGNDESKKMRKSMLKQEFSEFRVSKSEGLHKGYDMFQKILSQLNQMQAKPDNEDCNMKFLRALPPSWSQVAITLKTKGGLDYLTQRYSFFQTEEPGYKTEEPKALLSVDSMLNWSDHEGKDVENGAAQVYGMDCRELKEDALLWGFTLEESKARFVKAVGMHVVPPPITGTFMPPSNNPDLDDTLFTFVTSLQTQRPLALPSCCFKCQVSKLQDQWNPLPSAPSSVAFQTMLRRLPDQQPSSSNVNPAVCNACYVLKRVLSAKPITRPPYELVSWESFRSTSVILKLLGVFVNEASEWWRAVDKIMTVMNMLGFKSKHMKPMLQLKKPYPSPSDLANSMSSYSEMEDIHHHPDSGGLDPPKGEFEMSVMGELTFFLGLQVKQEPDGIFISQNKYVHDMLKKFDMESVRPATIPFEASKPKSKDELGQMIECFVLDTRVYTLTSQFECPQSREVLLCWGDSVLMGDRKSTTCGCQFLGRRLISWQCKKETIMATSSTLKQNMLLTGLTDLLVRVRTSASKEGPPAILATIDRTPYTITESLVRSQLQLDDDGGVEDLPIADIYLVVTMRRFFITSPPMVHSSSTMKVQIGGAEDLDKLTACLFSSVSSLVAEVEYFQESELKAHKTACSKDWKRIAEPMMWILLSSWLRQLLQLLLLQLVCWWLSDVPVVPTTDPSNQRITISFDGQEGTSIQRKELLGKRGRRLGGEEAVRKIYDEEQAELDKEEREEIQKEKTTYLEQASSKKSKSTEAPKSDVPADSQQPSVEVPSQKATIEDVEVPLPLLLS
ncbi:ribonuclease H-like domain-containing protein [Tanacetum coccineum]